MQIVNTNKLGISYIGGGFGVYLEVVFVIILVGIFNTIVGQLKKYV